MVRAEVAGAGAEPIRWCTEGALEQQRLVWACFWARYAVLPPRVAKA